MTRREALFLAGGGIAGFLTRALGLPEGVDAPASTVPNMNHIALFLNGIELKGACSGDLIHVQSEICSFSTPDRLRDI